MYFTTSIFVTLQLHVHILKVILCHLPKKKFLTKWQNKHQIACRVTKTISGIPLNHIGRCIQILENYATIKLHFNN